jgi:hypothetical protein
MPKTKRRVTRRKSKVKNSHKLRLRIAQLRKLLTEKSIEFRDRIKKIESSAQAKAVRDVITALSKKATEKIRALEAAEMKFEKKYGKKMMKQLPSLFTNHTKKPRRRRKVKAHGHPVQK